MAADVDRQIRRQVNDARQQLSDHALDQWDARMPDAARPPEWALAHAVRDDQVVALDHFQESSGRRADAAHLYRGRTGNGEVYGAVFLEVDDVLVTVYRMDTIWDPATRSYLVARVDQHEGIVDE